MDSLQFQFQNRLMADGIYLSEATKIATALHHLGIKPSCPTLVVVGGASGLTDNDLERLRSLFKEVICPIANTAGFVVVDGGTDAGVMRLMGQARAETGGTFPLIGVVVKAKVRLPNAPAADEDAADLEPHHTHFLLVPGKEWGEESSWIAEVATVLADGHPSITLLINGGAIALHQDVPNSLDHNRPVLVVAGSGRAADRLAAALSEPASDLELQSLVKSGLLHTIRLTDGLDAIRAAVQQVLEAARSPKSL